MMSLRMFALLSACTASCYAFSLVPPGLRRAYVPQPRPLFEPRMGVEDAVTPTRRARQAARRDRRGVIIDNVALYFSGQNKEDAQPPVRRRLPRSHIGSRGAHVQNASWPTSPPHHAACIRD